MYYKAPKALLSKQKAMNRSDAQKIINFSDHAPFNTARKQRKAERQVDEYPGRPFNPRIEISADARHIASQIVKNLWSIFVLLPAVAVILFKLLIAR
jgi:hypothetical protein